MAEEAGGGQDARVSDPGGDAGLGHTYCRLDGGSGTGLGLYVFVWVIMCCVTVGGAVVPVGLAGVVVWCECCVVLCRWACWALLCWF